ncbi:unnamed protein product [Amoebophrya sp. A25]|nr:unnamed protein product [Amoebophrya sp. A25]|eukprot:GSA25T00005914001.1
MGRETHPDAPRHPADEAGRATLNREDDSSTGAATVRKKTSQNGAGEVELVGAEGEEAGFTRRRLPARDSVQSTRSSVVSNTGD